MTMGKIDLFKVIYTDSLNIKRYSDTSFYSSFLKE